ncbi:hypothetical protein AVEN_124048-1 [Araneus ventricosus]|uniref:Uncharacterized protein n=1 Tax=Araneus ventricosus TaxID=182803 RepID=A0A4Y2KR08_ARAVE|nr:hypothetical protein AVEN_124048-1 [Araneus ventricosus]
MLRAVYDDNTEEKKPFSNRLSVSVWAMKAKRMMQREGDYLPHLLMKISDTICLLRFPIAHSTILMIADELNSRKSSVPMSIIKILGLRGLYSKTVPRSCIFSSDCMKVTVRYSLITLDHPFLFRLNLLK